MKVYVHKIAKKEILKLDFNVRMKFQHVFSEVEQGNPLPRSVVKKINKQLFEYRIKYDTNIYRALAAHVSPDIIILLVFQKKTQKLPIKEIRTANQRLKDVL